MTQTSSPDTDGQTHFVGPARRMAELAAYYEQLSPGNLERLGRFYAEQARFKDPFNDVVGVDAIKSIFRHMYDTVQQPRFVVHDTIVQGDKGFLVWSFHFYSTGGRTARAWEIKGGSHVQWGSDGRIVLHRDYWDAAEELYEKLPVLGGLMRYLKRKLAVPVVR